MKLRLLIIPALMATALFAQGPGGPGFGARRQAGSANTPPTPPTPEQAATRQANMISAFLKLGSAQSSALLAALVGTGATPSGPLVQEESTLQSNAVTLKADYATLAGDIANGSGSVANDVAAVNGVELLNLQARSTAAGQVLAELKTLAVTLTANQQTALINMIVRGGGGPGGFGGGFRGGRF